MRIDETQDGREAVSRASDSDVDLSAASVVWPSGEAGSTSFDAEWDTAAGRALPAWLLSVIVHATCVVSLVFLWRSTPQGAAEEPGRTVGIALAREANGETEFFDGDAPSSESSASASANASALPSTIPANPLLEGALPAEDSLVGGANDVGDLLATAGGMTRGAPSRNTTGGKARTSVFGVEGEGHRFVYVFDRSSSMDGYGGRPLQAAKSQLLASVQSLGRTHQFQIIFYNQLPHILNPFAPQPAKMLYGDDHGKAAAERFVRSVVASGATRHFEALQAALAMQPDVIFFLTDALDPALSRSQLAEIRRLNFRAGASIHTIEFGARDKTNPQNFLTELARQNDGQYVYVNVTRLPVTPR